MGVGDSYVLMVRYTREDIRLVELVGEYGMRIREISSWTDAGGEVVWTNTESGVFRLAHLFVTLPDGRCGHPSIKWRFHCGGPAVEAPNETRV